jgi:hypothetical protein
MRENGWLEKEFQAANKRVSEWPEWKKEIEAKNSSFELKEPQRVCPDEGAPPEPIQSA